MNKWGKKSNVLNFSHVLFKHVLFVLHHIVGWMETDKPLFLLFENTSTVID